MRIIAEEIEGAIYQDIIISEEEASQLKAGHIFEAQSMIKGKRLYIGLRIGEKWHHNDTNGD